MFHLYSQMEERSRMDEMLIKMNEVEALFAQHSIGEIREIEKSMRQKTENKREELRLMVGRRYRDIIEASDELYIMQRDADSSTDQLNTLECLLSSLRNYPKADGGAQHSPADRQRYSAMFMSDLCDMICMSIVGQKWSEIVYLMPLIFHISSDVDHVALNQIWREIYAFRPQLLDQCVNSATLDMDLSEICSILYCACELHGDCDSSARRAPRVFFSRCLRILEEMCQGTNLTSRETIKLFVDSWFSAILVAHAVFVSTFRQPAVFIQHIRRVKGSPPDVLGQYIAVKPKPVRQVLNQLIASCKWTCQNVTEDDLSLAHLREATDEFLQKSFDLYASVVHRLLSTCDSLETLTKRRRGIDEVLNACTVSEGWQMALDDMFRDTSPSNIIDSFNQPIVDRAATLMQEIIRRAFDSLAMVNVESGNCMSSMWMENPVDSGHSVTLCLLGVPWTVMSQCESINTEYKTILTALDEFWPRADDYIRFSEHDGRAPAISLQKPIVDTSVEEVEKLCNKLESIHVSTAMAWAKFLQSLLVNCDNLKAVFFVRDKCSAAWQRLSTSVSKTFDHLCKECASAAASRVSENFNRRLGVQRDQPLARVENLINWKPVRLENVQSPLATNIGLLAPTKLSRWAMHLLQEMSAELALMGSHCAPSDLVHFFSSVVVTSVLDALAEMTATNQQEALQTLFDLDVLAMLLFNADTEPSLKTKHDQLVNELRRNVDAFDLELTRPCLEENARKQLYSLLALFGNVTTDVQVVSRRLGDVEYSCEETTESTIVKPLHFAKIITQVKT